MRTPEARAAPRRVAEHPPGGGHPVDIRVRRYQAVERALAAPMLALSLLIVPVLLLPLAWPSMPAPGRTALDAIDAGIWVAFAAEYLTLLVLAPLRREYVRTHLIELALVVLPMLRPLRILRSAPALRLVSAGRAVAGGASAARLSRRHLARSAGLYAPGAAALLVLAAAAVVRGAEQGDPHANITGYGDALWWAITTVTGVGYGDRYPVTAPGRVAAAALMLLGLALLGVITASLAAAFTRWATEAEQQADELREAAEAATLTAVLGELGALRAEVAVLREVQAPRDTSTEPPGSR
ncbi:MAG: Ion transport 2 domain protein [Frankiales bacterium]|nr:Ion transport 2 domain protein [Frankiales bacterium]